MLNPTYPKSLCDTVVSPYIAPESIINITLHGNQSNNTGAETRLHPVFGEEIWLKLSRAGITPSSLNQKSVLEVCAGTGFLTYHLLAKSTPKKLVINDISESEMAAAKSLIKNSYPLVNIDWVLGDMHTINCGGGVDVIIGNSFIHHFYNVPHVMARFYELLNPGGIFITLHEPTPMSTIVESGKALVWPLAMLAPKFVNNFARKRYKGEPSATDLWMFEKDKLEQVALQSGFKFFNAISWGLFRPLVVQRNSLHTSADKPTLNELELSKLAKAIKFDSILNRFLPSRCFGSLCVVCRK